MLQLLKYVTWPESAVPATSPFVVGVFGDDAFAAALREVVTAEQAQGRAVEVKTLAEGTSAGIHLLFWAAGARRICASSRASTTATRYSRWRIASISRSSAATSGSSSWAGA